jgi:hypothetical protein
VFEIFFLFPFSKSENILYAQTGHQQRKKDNIVPSSSYSSKGIETRKVIKTSTCHYADNPNSGPVIWQPNIRNYLIKAKLQKKGYKKLEKFW